MAFLRFVHYVANDAHQQHNGILDVKIKHS